MTIESTVRKSRPPSRKLPAPLLARAREGIVDPAWSKAVITVKPYPLMSCGDELMLYWRGLNNEGEQYHHQIRRFVTERQVGRELVFVVREPHIAELDGGSLEISYRVIGKQLPTELASQALQLQIGDVAPLLLPPIANDAVGGHLDPGRVPEGTTMTVRPYSRMAAGDRLILLASRDSKPLWRDVLDIEAHAVGEKVSFWIDHGDIASHIGHSLTVAYVVRRGHSIRRAEPLSVWIGPLVRPALVAPRVLELMEGELDVDGLHGAATVVIDGVGLEAGERVWLQCDGSYSDAQEREITEATAGQPVVFTVPIAYWQEQGGQSVRLFYQVERLDDVSQRSPEITIEVRARP
ncbi:hypothetical protein [Pseudomonas sp. D1-36]|uniref:hypothetical protein n=1 Tax=Pseudomonas sp. D1-36 TaxID=2817387 RepID=UPI003DA88097